MVPEQFAVRRNVARDCRNSIINAFEQAHWQPFEVRTARRMRPRSERQHRAAILRNNPCEHHPRIAACGLAEALHVRVCVATFADDRQLVCSVDVSISEHQIFYSFLGHKSSDISYVLSWYQPEAAEACTVGLGVFRSPLYAVRYVDSCAVVCPLEIGLEVARDNNDLIGIRDK